MKSLLNFFFVFFLLPAGLFGQSAAPHFIPGSVYVKIRNFDPEVQPLQQFQSFYSLLGEYGILETTNPFGKLLPSLNGIIRIKLNQASNAAELISKLRQLPVVEYAEQAAVPRIFGVNFLPGQVNPKSEWYFNRINIRNGWDYYSQRGDKSVVAIVDNAIFIEHEALRKNLWKNPGEIPDNGIDDDENGFIDDVNGVNMFSRTGNPNPPPFASTRFFGHGTHVAGLTTANPELETGIFSIGINTRLIAIRASADADSNTGALSFALEGLAYAISMKPDVINLSWGYTFRSKVLEDLINAAVSDNIIVVAAAGNYGTNDIVYPAAFEGVLSVGATDDKDLRLTQSQYGWIGVNAPGKEILSSISGNTKAYAEMSGTSMACAIVSGFAGMLVSQFPKRRDVVPLAIKMGADNIDFDNPGFEGKLGHGRINVDMSIQLLNDPSLSINRAKNSALGIYPNPAKDRIQLHSSDFEHFEKVEIINIHGQVFQVVLDSAGEAAINEFAGGIYMIRAYSPTGAMLQSRLVIVR